MWEIIAAVLLCVFAVIGFTEAVRALIFKICKPKKENAYIVLNVGKDTEEIELILRSWIQRIKWLGAQSPNNIIVIDKGLSDEQKKICRLLNKESGFIKICTPSELCKFFR